MTEYEIRSLSLQGYALWINGLYVLVTLLLAAIALWGERIRQWWMRPKLVIVLDDATLTSHSDTDKKGWYYHLRVKNGRRTSPASNVRLLLTGVQKKGPDDSWQERKFSGPVQVTWRWPQQIPQFATIGPDEHSTFARILEGSNTIELRLYWCPMNLIATISPHDKTRLHFKAVSDTTESKSLIVEIAWDGQFEQGTTEMGKHMVVHEVHV
jgi:hypothetical protein